MIKKLPITATKQEIEDALVRHRMRKFPDLYAGHEDDARFFVRPHEARTRRDALLTAQCYGLAETDY